jgi:hypothetical protein
LPRSHSHNVPTNPRNKPKLKETQKRNSRSKELRQPAVPRQTVHGALADGTQGVGGRSARSRQTVRNCYLNNQYCTLKYRQSVANPRTVWPARTAWQPRADSPANLFEPKTPSLTDRNEATQEHAKKLKYSRLTRTSRTVHTMTADGLPITKTANRARPLEGQHLLPFT